MQTFQIFLTLQIYQTLNEFNIFHVLGMSRTHRKHQEPILDFRYIFRGGNDDKGSEVGVSAASPLPTAQA